MPEGISLVKK
jgi:hypothetical protein